jgi:hypothetical protein
VAVQLLSYNIQKYSREEEVAFTGFKDPSGRKKNREAKYSYV